MIRGATPELRFMQAETAIRNALWIGLCRSPDGAVWSRSVAFTRRCDEWRMAQPRNDIIERGVRAW